MKPDKQKVCLDFCRIRRITLKGCPRCSSDFLKESDNEKKSERRKEDESGEKESSNSRVAVAVLPPRLPPSFTPGSVGQSPVRHSHIQLPSFEYQATTGATTPDWKQMCTHLCRSGSGGLLCNCDLPPF
jgi:hypothetical protein